MLHRFDDKSTKPNNSGPNTLALGAWSANGCLLRNASNATSALKSGSCFCMVFDSWFLLSWPTLLTQKAKLTSCLPSCPNFSSLLCLLTDTVFPANFYNSNLWFTSQQDGNNLTVYKSCCPYFVHMRFARNSTVTSFSLSGSAYALTKCFRIRLNSFP